MTPASGVGRCELCGSDVPTIDLMSHIATHHPNHYEPFLSWPDGGVVMTEELDPRAGHRPMTPLEMAGVPVARPGDRLVVFAPGAGNRETQEALKAGLEEQLPGLQIVVVGAERQGFAGQVFLYRAGAVAESGGHDVPTEGTVYGYGSPEPGRGSSVYANGVRWQRNDLIGIGTHRWFPDADGPLPTVHSWEALLMNSHPVTSHPQPLDDNPTGV